MSLARDLLLQAEHLSSLDERKPRQANLRRAISAAYYALFHLLIADAVQRFSPARPAGLAARVARALSHGEMKQVCRFVAEGRPPVAMSTLLPSGCSRSLTLVARSFIALQDARHTADYDLSVHFDRTEAGEYVLAASDAFEAWKSVRRDEEATVFLAALLFAARWSK